MCYSMKPRSPLDAESMILRHYDHYYEVEMPARHQWKTAQPTLECRHVLRCPRGRGLWSRSQFKQGYLLPKESLAGFPVLHETEQLKNVW